MEEPRQRSHPVHGFTLVELMVVLAVFTILASAGIPALQSMVADHRHAAYVNTLVGHIQRARTEAVRRGHPATLCPSADASTCDNGGWQDGWLLFADEDGDGSVDTGEDLLAIGEDLPGSRTAYNRNRLTFLYDGTTPFNGTFTLTLCDASQARVTRLVISRGGRLRKVNGTPSNCP
ncbi:type IV fimbrial biogenesis protein FimT [Thiohalospira halophila DSM 15071]|uniref:Type II secretion system protein H n=1 Tax=Thiohalospira halophila DSM 15071 TaxID=1123397 RepID=A0A1I1PEB4_9GAMM|nr:GspH/FimT family pseudopilin [Thiohalospira halophila]SFD07962.1 type IV fimbrial biogenesis protein FimT [Thiohalospira halophila DSM 15071]